MTDSAAPPDFSAARAERYRLEHVPDEALHTGVRTLVGRHNVTMADLLAYLAEVDARGIYRERACSSLYTYCIYELRFSEDEAQRRAGAARTARQFPALFEMLAEGAIHLTGLLLLAPHLTKNNHAEVLARARFRTKREIERLVAEVAPRPDVPARIEPLAPARRPSRAPGKPTRRRCADRFASFRLARTENLMTLGTTLSSHPLRRALVGYEMSGETTRVPVIPDPNGNAEGEASEGSESDRPAGRSGGSSVPARHRGGHRPCR